MKQASDPIPEQADTGTSAGASPSGEAFVSSDQSASGFAASGQVNIPDEIRIGRWFVVLMLLLSGIVIAGGTVRLTDSGMSIPEWPLIYYGEGKTKPSVLPPFFNEGAWENASQTYHHEYLIPSGKEVIAMGQFKQEFLIEYFHRFIVSLFGIVYLAVVVQVFRNPVLRQRIGKMLGIASVILILQIILGGTVVLNHTHPLYVSTHLVTAFTFISLMMWMMLRLFRPTDAPLPEKPARSLKWAWITVAVCSVQIFIGGIVAKTKAGYHYNTWPEMGESVVPPASALWHSHYTNPLMNFIENMVFIQFFHRWWAFVVLAMVMMMVIRLMKKPLTPGGRFAIRGVVGVVVFQILLGIVTLLEAVPYSLGIAHLLTGLILLQMLILITFEVKTNPAISRLEQEARDSRANRRHWEDDAEPQLDTGAPT